MDVQQRRLMLERFEEAFGREVATLLMEHITATDVLTVATKADLQELRTDLGRDIDAVRHDLGQEINGLRHDLGQEINGLRHEIDGVRKDMQGLRHELLGTLHRELAAQTKSLILALAASLAAVAGIAFGLG